MAKPIAPALRAAACLLLLPLQPAVSNEPREGGNPCAAYIEDQQRRRTPTAAERPIAGRPFLYNGVDDMAAPLDRPIALSSDFTGPYRASCVIFEVRFADRNGRLTVTEATPRLVYPSRRSDALPAHQRAGETVLRQIPFDRLVRQKPGTQTPHLVAVPLWPRHPLYTNDQNRVAGPVSDELKPMGYGEAERIASDSNVSIYRITEQVQRDELVVKLVAVRTIGELEPLVTLRPVTSNTAAGPIMREVPQGEIAEIFERTLAPWLLRRAANNPLPVRQIRAEVRHYAHNFRMPFDERNAEARVPFVVDPRTERPTDHPVFIVIHSALIRPGGAPVQWSHNVSPPAYANLAELRLMLAEARISKEERARRAQAEQAERLATEGRNREQQDASLRQERGRIDVTSPLASIGYPNARLLFKDGHTTYYLADLASMEGTVKIRPVVAVHDIGANDPVLNFVDAGDGDVRYADPRIAFVRSKLVPAALARWPDLRRLEIHHHVRGQPLTDTAEYRRAGARAYGFTYDQPVFEEQYSPDKASGLWRPEYELDSSRPRLVDLSLREYGRTVAEARLLRGEIDERKRLAELTPAQRRAELTAQRVAAAAKRSPDFVYKSDRFWASLPRSYIAEQTFNGDFDRFQVKVQFPRHYVEFVYAYSRHCEAEIKAAGNYAHDTFTTQQVTVDGYGFTKFEGAPKTTHTYIPGDLVAKYDEYSKIVALSTAGEAMALVLNPDDMAAMGARMLSTSPLAFMKSLVNARQGSQGLTGEMFSNLLGLTYTWNQFFKATPNACRSATVHQMRENLLRAAQGRPSLQKAGMRVANAATESQPLVPPRHQRTVFDACHENHEYKNADLCICMDLQGEKIMRPEEKRRYIEDFQLFYDEIVFPMKSSAADPRWRLYELHKQCAR